MHNGPAFFEIQVDNIERAKKFYSDLFGWKFTKDEGLSLEYWRIETASSRGGMLLRPAPIAAGPSGTNAFTCSIEVSNFDEMVGKILFMGGQIALPKFAVPNVCWQGYFIDTEGNTFGLFQPDRNAK